MIPTVRAAALFAGAAVSSIPLGSGVLLAGAIVVVLGMAADWWVMRHAPEAHLDLAPILPRGRPVPFRLSISEGVGRHQVRLVTPPDVRADPDRAEGTLLTGELVADRRGHHTVGPAATRSIGPLGLGARHRTIDIETMVIVYPDVVAARSISRAVAMGHFGGQGLRRGSPHGIGTEFDSIRSYAPDDDVRQINWKATMRAGRPMSNVYRVDQDRDVILAVDTGRLMAAPVDRMTRLDAAVDAATAVAYTADQLGDRVGVVAFAGKVLRHLVPRRRGGEGVVRALFDLEPIEAESNYEAAFRLANRSKRGLVVVFTDLFEETAARPLVDAVPILVRTHEVVIANTRDDDLNRAVAGDPESTIDPYRVAVALEALAAQRRVVRSLVSAGAHFAEAAAGRLGSAVVDAYLDIKRRARV